jgi:hypothetical protein
MDQQNADPQNVDPQNMDPQNVDPQNADQQDVDPQTFFGHSASPQMPLEPVPQQVLQPILTRPVPVRCVESTATLNVRDAFGIMNEDEKYVTTQFFKKILQAGILVHVKDAENMLHEIYRQAGVEAEGRFWHTCRRSVYGLLGYTVLMIYQFKSLMEEFLRYMHGEADVLVKNKDLYRELWGADGCIEPTEVMFRHFLDNVLFCHAKSLVSKNYWMATER